MKTKYVKYLRVSTKKQGSSGLGLAAQSDIIDYFIKDGVLIDTFSEVYTGTDLKNCVELRKAINLCKQEGAKLILYKSDRFRNVDDALAVMAELGEGNLICCDIPNADRFTFILFFAIAEREAILISLRTTQALRKITQEIEKHGYHTSARSGRAVTSLGAKKGEANIAAAQMASVEARAKAISMDSNRKRQWLLMQELKNRGDHLKDIADTLNITGERTPKGALWTVPLVSRALSNWGKFFHKNRVSI